MPQNNKISEKDIQNSIIEYLKYRGHLIKRNNSGRILIKGKSGFRSINLGESGWPDIIGCDKKGRFIGIEVKKPGNKPTREQLEIINEINNRPPGLAFVAYSLDDVINKGL